MAIQDRFDLGGAAAYGAQAIVRFGTYAGKPAAFKLARPQDRDAIETKQRAVTNEALILSRLGTSRAPELYALMNDEFGLPVLVTEKIEGQVLANAPSAQTASESGLLDIAAAVADVLSDLEALGTLHRDIKPENIILDPDRKARVIDFGFAATDRTGDESDHGIGSLYYIAPEVLLETATSHDIRSDFYSLGVVLYEMATGRLPYRSEDPSEHTKIVVNGSHTPLVELRGDLDRHLVDFIERLLKKSPEKRFQSTRDLRQALERLGVSKPDRPSPPGTSPGAVETIFPTEARRLRAHFEGFVKNAKSVKSLVLVGADGSGKSSLLHHAWEKTENCEDVILVTVDCDRAEPLPLANFGRFLESICTEQAHRNQGERLEELAAEDPGLVAGVLASFSGLARFFPHIEPHLTSVDLAEPTMLEFARKLLQDHRLIIFHKNFRNEPSNSLTQLKKLAAGREQILRVFSLAEGVSPTDLGLEAFEVVKLPRLADKRLHNAAKTRLGGGTIGWALLELLDECGSRSLFTLDSCIERWAAAGQLAFDGSTWEVTDPSQARSLLRDLASDAVAEQIASLTREDINVLDALLVVAHEVDEASLVSLCASVVAPETVKRSLKRLVNRKLVREPGPKRYESSNAANMKRALTAQDELSHRRICENYAAVLLDWGVFDPEAAYRLARLWQEQDESLTPTVSDPAYVYMLAGDFSASRRSDPEAIALYSIALERGPATREDRIRILQGICDLALLCHRVDDAYRHAGELITISQARLTRAKGFLIQCRCLFAHLNADGASRHAADALHELGINQHVSRPARFLRAVWVTLKIFASRLIRRPLRRPPDEDEVATKSSIFLSGALAAFHNLNLPRMMELMLFAFEYSLKVPGSAAAARSRLNVASVTSTLGIKGLTNHLLKSARDIATRRDDKRLQAEIEAYAAYYQDFMGHPRRAYLLADEVALKRAVWLDHADFLNLRFFIQWNLLLRGYYRRALDSMVDLSNTVYRNYSKSDPRRIIEYSHSAALFAVSGEEAKAAEFGRLADELERSPAASHITAYYWAVYLGEKMLKLLSIGAEEDVLDSCYSQYLERCGKACSGGPLLTVAIQQFYVLAKIQCLLTRAEFDPKFRLTSICRQVWGLKRFAIFKPHLEYFKAAEHWLRGNDAKALQTANSAIQMAEIADAPLVKAIALDLKARVFEGRRHDDQARIARLDARRISYATGDLRRFHIITSRLPVRDQRPDTEEQPTPSGSTMTTAAGPANVERFVDAMRTISESLCNISDPEMLITNILDRMITMICAERGVVFFLADDESFESILARDYQNQNFDPTGTISQSMVKRTIESREMQISGIEDESQTASASIVAHRLRSIATIPLVYNGKLLAVIYFDSRAARGLFKKHHIDLLNILANNVAVTIQSARAIRNEINRHTMERQLALTGTVQSLLIPSESSKAFGPIRLRSFFQPSAESGGDWYQYVYDEKRRAVHVLVGDVTGHGPGPAMVTALVSGVFSQSVSADGALEVMAFLRDLNEAVRKTRDFMMSMVVLTVPLETQTCELVSCGGPPPMISRKGAVVRRLMVRGTPLGMLEDEPVRETFDYGPGDRILLPTDGLFEMLPRDGGSPRKAIKRLMEEGKEESFDDLHGHLQTYIGERQPLPDYQDDDISFVLIERSGDV